MNQGHVGTHTKTRNNMERKLTHLSKAALRFVRASDRFIDWNRRILGYKPGTKGYEQAIAKTQDAALEYSRSEVLLRELCQEYGGVK